MKHSFSIFSLVVPGLSVVFFSALLPANAAVNVTQHHNNPSRDGLYIDPSFSTTAAANLTRDLSFNGTIVGNVYSQPLYIEGGPSGPVVIVATESNNVYALKVSDGLPLWQRNVGTPSTGMGNISPVGITGTPVVDLASRSLFFDAVISGPNNLIFSLNVDTGDINPGWPVDVNARISGFSSTRQSQRAALGVLGSIVYVPYGGYFGDAQTYFGRVLGVQINNPAATIGSFATTSTRAGIWGPGGIASDGTDLFVTTGNGAGGATWSGSEAVIRLQPGPVFSNSTVDYFAPTNWASLDGSDSDLGGSGPVLVDVPGATPSALVIQFGKDGKAYLLNRNNLGGVSTPVASPSVGGSGIQAAATYRTAMGTYVVFRPTTNTLTAFRITATNPPAIQNAWSVTSSGRGSPFVTSTDGTNNVIVWAVGSAGGDQRLHGHNGDTGAVVYNGGGANELMSGTRGYNTAAIAARGRIYVANDNKVYAFNVPLPALQLSSAVSRKTHTGAGDFDIDLPLTGEPGVECRNSGGSHTFVITFSNQTVSGNASVTSGTGTVAGSPTFSGNTMTVNVTGVTDVQKLTVTLSSVTDNFGQVLADTAVSVNMLVGDTNANKTVNASDIAQTKAQSGLSVTGANFRTDINVDGSISASDVSEVKANTGNTLP